MARFNHGVFSKAKNKLGGVTFQQYEGMQIGKEYQPNVKNPNAPKQVATRARFSLSSKINALLYPYLSPVMKSRGVPYERFQRGESLKELMANTSFDINNEVATLDDMPTFKPNTSASDRTTADGISISVGDGATFSGMTIPDAPVFALLVIIPLTGTPAAKVIETTADNTGKWSAISGAGFIPSGFQGSIVGIAYATEESDTLTGVSYNDLAGLSATAIAELGIADRMTTNLLLTNTAEAKAWQA